MKNILLIIALALTVMSCGNKNNSKSTTSVEQESISLEKDEVAMIYFHSNHRCATCMAVENTSKEALKEFFNNEIPFFSIDLTADQNASLIEEYKIGSQTLMIVKGDTRKNITSNAFMFARSNPDKVKSEIKTVIDSL